MFLALNSTMFKHTMGISDYGRHTMVNNSMYFDIMNSQNLTKYILWIMILHKFTADSF